VPLVRVPRTLPKILAPGEVDRLLGALRTDRDTAMVLAMVLAGLRRCEVLGLRMADVRVGDRCLFVAAGKGGHQRVVPVAGRFLQVLGGYLHDERPAAAPTDRLFVVLKGPRRVLPLSAEGLDEILAGARRRAGLDHATCHELRHTCLTRLREAGMALEAVQAQAGHRSIESTRIYLNSRKLHQTGEGSGISGGWRPEARVESPAFPGFRIGSRRYWLKKAAARRAIHPAYEGARTASRRPARRFLAGERGGAGVEPNARPARSPSG
jgi:integrase